jgi:hypothetical protein
LWLALGVTTTTLSHAMCQAQRRRPELESGNQHVQQVDEDGGTAFVCMTTKEIVLETFTCENVSLLKQDPEAKKMSYLKQVSEAQFSFWVPNRILKSCIDHSDRVPHRRALQESVVTLELYYMEVSSF